MPKRIFAVLYVSVMGLTCCYKTTVFYIYFHYSTIPHLYSIAVARHTLTQRSKGQRSRSHGYENRHGRTVASDACCYGRVLLLQAWVCVSIRLCLLVVTKLTVPIWFITNMMRSRRRVETQSNGHSLEAPTNGCRHGQTFLLCIAAF